MLWNRDMSPFSLCDAFVLALLEAAVSPQLLLRSGMVSSLWRLISMGSCRLAASAMLYMVLAFSVMS
eukprot:37613-Pyramimonas_sp.AAC.1